LLRQFHIFFGIYWIHLLPECIDGAELKKHCIDIIKSEEFVNISDFTKKSLLIEQLTFLYLQSKVFVSCHEEGEETRLNQIKEGLERAWSSLKSVNVMESIISLFRGKKDNNK
jgi:polynucleotide 5'-kinase involved in rRNA processing